jgi:hypothetical protein
LHAIKAEKVLLKFVHKQLNGTLFVLEKQGLKMKRALLIAGLISMVPALAFASCGSAFCTVNTNWTTESAMVDAGSSFDLRYEYIKQDQPRAGTEKISVGQIHHHHDEVSTVNRNLIASYSHVFASGWGVSVTAPFMDRDHLHVHNHRGTPIPEEWDYREVGDVRVTGRYLLPFFGDPANPASSGVNFGVKLPTGRTGVSNAAGSEAERSLQPGTGTTDLILGAFYHQRLPERDLSWFIQAQAQRALKAHAGYRPGGQLTADLGARYSVWDKLGALVQLNMVAKARDSGPEAEPADSGSRSLFVSPGVSYAIGDSMQVYAFVQQPIYQKVNGVQLTADRAFTAGISGRF